MTAPDPVDVPPAPRSAVLCAPWASPADVPEARRGLLSVDGWEQWLMAASEILYWLSGTRFTGAGCTEEATLRSRPPSPGMASWPYSPTWGSCACWAFGIWENRWLVPPRGDYNGRHLSPMVIKLPRAPVNSVTGVTLNGDAFAAWRVNRAGWLERTDGRPWVVCNDETVVTYTFGEAPPETGVMAAVELAVQFALALNNESSCQLPQRVQSVTRQGVTIAMLDTQDFLKEGRTGIYLVDLFLTAINPDGRRRRGSVWSPDLPAAFRS